MFLSLHHFSECRLVIGGCQIISSYSWLPDDMALLAQLSTNNWIKNRLYSAVVYNCFLQKVVKQSHTDVTSFCMQFEKIGRGLLGKFLECFVSRKRGGNKKGSGLENGGEHWSTLSK